MKLTLEEMSVDDSGTHTCLLWQWRAVYILERDRNIRSMLYLTRNVETRFLMGKPSTLLIENKFYG